MTKRVAGVALTLSFVFAASAFAQDPKQPKPKDKTRWGVTAGFSPDWIVDKRDKLGDSFFNTGDDAQTVNITGYEFRVGVARGRELGSDWAVTFVRRRIDDGSTLGSVESICETHNVPPFPTGASRPLCALEGRKTTYHDASLMGLEINKFFAFATIKKRVQIGMNLAIGVAQMHGTAEVDKYNAFLFPNGNFIVDPNSPTHSTVDAKDTISMHNQVLGKVMFSVAGILPGSIKLRFDTGWTFPGIMHFSLTGTHFFGHR